MASEDSGDGSAAVSDASRCKCDTVSAESRVASPRAPEIIGKAKSPRMSAEFGSYLDKAIAQGSRAFHGTDCEASDDDNDSGCDAELIGKAAHALSEDINDRIRYKVGPCSPSPGKNDESATLANPAPPEKTKVDQGCNSSQPDCEERSAQTAGSEEDKRQEVANTATQSSAPPAQSSAQPEWPSADPELLKQRASQLDERVRLLKERKMATRKPSSIPGASFAEQLKKIDLSLDGGTLKMCVRNLSENALATIVNAVRSNDKLMELDLSGCCIQKGDDLADLVRNAPNLQRLLLASNCLGSARTGVAALASAIASATSLQEVDLRSNRIGPATAAALALALRTNNTLKRLGSSRVGLQTRGLLHLFVLSHMQLSDLMWNEIGASGATAMLGLLEKNHSLTELKLAGNNIPCQLLEELDTLLETNRSRQAHPDDCCEDLHLGELISGTSLSIPVAVYPKCRDGSSRFSKVIPESPQVQRQSSKCAEPGAKGRIQENSEKIMPDELQIIRKNLADLKVELVDLQTQKAELMKQLEGSREELNEETKRREQVERDFEEVRMEFCKNQEARADILPKEMECLQGKLHASACESSERLAALETETMSRRESERATLERETEVTKQNQCLIDQLARLREDSDERIQALEAKCISNAEHNAELVQKLESSIAERDQNHLQEVEALRSQLIAEIDSLKSMNDNLMMEVEKQKANTKVAEQQLENQRQVLQQEKDAVEEELKRQISMHMVEIECLQHHLEDKDKEHAKGKQRHELCVQALENDLKKERASVSRSELSNCNAEEKIATMEDHMDQLKEKYKAEQERTMLLEERNRADELIHNSCMIALSSKHSEEQEKMKGDKLLHRKQVEALKMQNREMRAEHERRMKDIEIQLRGAKTAIVEWIQQQFSALQAALSFHTTVPAIEYGALRRSQIEETGGAFEDPPRPPRMSQLLYSSPLSPRISRSSQSMAKTSPVVSPRVSRVSQTMATISPASTPRAARPDLSTADTVAHVLGPRYSRTTTPEATPPPPSRISQISPAVAQTCLTPFLSVTGLVPPHQDEEVATVEEDLVSSGGESVNTEEF